MASKVTQSFGMLLKNFRELPYIAEKKHSKYYLLPHRPMKPEPINFKIVSKKIVQYTDKYNQYFSPQKLRTKHSTKQGQSRLQGFGLVGIDEPHQVPIQTNQQSEANLRDHQAIIQQFFVKSHQYNYKYKEPLLLMSTNPFHIFRKEEICKIKEQQEKRKLQAMQSMQNGLNQQKLLQRNTRKQKIQKGYEKSQANLQSINKLNLPAKWRSLTPQQKQVYVDMELNIKQDNEKRIQQFIQNHEIPLKKKYSTISRFTMRYSSIHQVGIRDKKLYEIYRALPLSEKEVFTNEAKMMNQQSRQRYENFLKRWNLSEQMLKNIIEVSVEYKKAKIQKNRDTRKKNKQGMMKFYEEDEEDDDDDFDHTEDKAQQ